ncbi:hypothetical protein DKT77_07480 [Meridianimarinicoccus roseus]|uniref:Uncharacterized protein n=1 Tax=Meridianimarinicoccus roseus TaxID=2072018 RepID=A0A2V2LJA9_9RHOB|nr:hypothetical protein [Meridianimarinicoccus roseus]PWR03296.1 hypothetical protein DKT77_07480 [Meridianimarinicoccus roseus]
MTGAPVPVVIPRYSALLAVLLIGLSVRLIRMRMKQRDSMGDSHFGSLRSAIRAKGKLAQ